MVEGNKKIQLKEQIKIMAQPIFTIILYLKKVKQKKIAIFLQELANKK